MNFKKTFITLSNIDVNEYTEKKGQFTNLSWTWAWKTLVENTESAAYIWNEDKVFSDGTMEVSCSLTVNDHTLPMWLAVTDYKNEAIKEPDSASINTARMRCLVKAMAMFGLGHYIYAGESFPEDVDVKGVQLPANSNASPEQNGARIVEPPTTKVDIKKLLKTIPKCGYATKDNKTYEECVPSLDKDITYWGSRSGLNSEQQEHLSNLRAIKLSFALDNEGVL